MVAYIIPRREDTIFANNSVIIRSRCKYRLIAIKMSNADKTRTSKEYGSMFIGVCYPIIFPVIHIAACYLHNFNGLIIVLNGPHEPIDNALESDI